MKIFAKLFYTKWGKEVFLDFYTVFFALFLE